MRDTVIQAVAKVLGVDTSLITEKTGVGDLGWDSLNHTFIIMAVENIHKESQKALGLKPEPFDMMTQMEIQNVRDLIMAVEE